MTGEGRAGVVILRIFAEYPRRIQPPLGTSTPLFTYSPLLPLLPLPLPLLTWCLMICTSERAAPSPSYYYHGGRKTLRSDNDKEHTLVYGWMCFPGVLLAIYRRVWQTHLAEMSDACRTDYRMQYIVRLTTNLFSLTGRHRELETNPAAGEIAIGA